MSLGPTPTPKESSPSDAERKAKAEAEERKQDQENRILDQKKDNSTAKTIGGFIGVVITLVVVVFLGLWIFGFWQGGSEPTIEIVPLPENPGIYQVQDSGSNQ